MMNLLISLISSPPSSLLGVSLFVSSESRGRKFQTRAPDNIMFAGMMIRDSSLRRKMRLLLRRRRVIAVQKDRFPDRNMGTSPRLEPNRLTDNLPVEQLYHMFWFRSLQMTSSRGTHERGRSFLPPDCLNVICISVILILRSERYP